MSYWDDQIDDFEIDGDDLEESDFEGGGFVSKPGFYHVICQDVTPKDEEGKLKRVTLKLQVLEGTEKSERHKTLYHDIYLETWKDKDKGETEPLSKGSRAVGTKFFIGFGLLSKDVAGSAKIKWPFGKMKGAQAIVKVDEETYTDKDGNKKTNYKIQFGNAYRLDDEEVKHVPRDKNTIDMAKSLASGTVDTNDL